MEIYTDLVDRYVNNEEFETLGRIKEDIEKQTFSLLGLVECLGSALSSTNVRSRALGTKMLAETLHLIPHAALRKQEAEVLVKFIEERFKDHHSVTPHLIHATEALVQSSETTDQQIHILLRAIFREIHIQSLLQPERNHMYTLVKYLLTHRPKALRDMSADFVMGYIQAMDGEKDPRNLLVAFQCVKLLADNLVLGAFTEDLFETVACYFPIDFTPPPNDERGVTKEDLVSALSLCLSAHKDFAEFCLDLILEKLSSTISSAKVECYLLLVTCASVYKHKLPEYSGSLWAAIRRDVFSLTNEKVEKCALCALTAIVKALSSVVMTDQDNSALRAFVTEALQETKDQLLGAQMLVAPPCGELLRAIMAGSLPASIQITEATVPALTATILQEKHKGKKKMLLEELTLLLNQAEPELVACVLLKYQLELYECYISGLGQMSEDLVCASLRGLKELVRLSGLLIDDQYSHSAQYLQALALHPSNSIRLLALETLQSMMSGLSDFCIKRLVNVLWAAVLSESADSDCDSEEMKVDDPDLTTKQTIALSSLAAISTGIQVAKLTVQLIVDQLCCDKELSRPCVSLTRGLTAELKSILQQTAEQTDCGQYYWDSVLERLYKLCIGGATDPLSSFCSWDVLSPVHGCVRLILCGQRHRSVDSIVGSTVDIFLDWNLGAYKSPSGAEVADLQPDSPEHQTQVTGLVCAVLGSLPASYVIPRQSELLEKLLDFSLQCPVIQSSTAAAKCLASVLNKQPDESSLGSVEARVRRVLEDRDDSAGCERALLLMVWVTKALLLGGYPQQKLWVDTLLSLVRDSDLGVQVAQGFSVVLEDCEDVLTVAMAARVLFMYKQRFFTLTVDRLLTDFSTAQKEAQAPYLVAVAHLLKNVPKQVTDPYLPQLLPLTVQCLHQEGSLSGSLWLAGLRMMSQITTDWPELVIGHVDDVVTLLLNMALCKENLHVRLSALECLQKLTLLSVTKLLPHQPVVVRRLARTLDDHKRLVRRQAVMARQKWILLDAPGV